MEVLPLYAALDFENPDSPLLPDVSARVEYDNEDPTPNVCRCCLDVGVLKVLAGC